MRLALATLALIGLATAAQPLTPKLYPEITLKGAVAQAVPDTDVTLMVTKIEDSRCPAGVDCYWEGMIRVGLTVTTPTSVEQITLCNLCDDAESLATAGGLTIGLVGLAPSTDELAKLGREPVLADYEVTVNYAPSE
ncbi:MAG TPA: hypothetical protein VK146_06070 [Tabrizicola sp.]|nr:hypothetical protein [Tabrizicola sp.]